MVVHVTQSAKTLNQTTLVNALTFALEMANVHLMEQVAARVTFRFQFVLTLHPTRMESAQTFALQKTAFARPMVTEVARARKDVKPRNLTRPVDVPVDVHSPIRNASIREEVALA